MIHQRVSLEPGLHRIALGVRSLRSEGYTFGYTSGIAMTVSGPAKDLIMLEIKINESTTYSSEVLRVTESRPAYTPGQKPEAVPFWRYHVGVNTRASTGLSAPLPCERDRAIVRKARQRKALWGD